MNEEHPSRTVLISLVVVGLCIAVLTVLSHMQGNTGQQRSEAIEAEIDETLGQPPAENPEARRLANKQTDAIYKSKMLEVTGVAKKLHSKIDKLAGLHGRWDTFVVELLTSESGRRIAASQVSLIAYDGLVKRERISPVEIETFRSQVKTLTEPIDQGLSESSYFKPDRAVLTAIQEDLGKVEELISNYEEAFDTLSPLTTTGDLAETTLQQALDQLHREQAHEQAMLIAEAEGLAVAEGNRRIAEERGELKRKQLEIEAQEIANRRRLAEEKAQKQSLIAECKRSDVRQKLAPFITPGTWLPYSKEDALDPRPHSWAMLDSRALQNNLYGYSQLIYIATITDDRKRPRIKWDHPKSVRHKICATEDRQATQDR